MVTMKVPTAVMMKMAMMVIYRTKLFKSNLLLSNITLCPDVFASVGLTRQ